MQKTENVLTRLYRDPIKNLSITGFAENNNITAVKVYKNSLYLKGTSDHSWIYFSCGNEEELCYLINELQDNDEYFASLEDWMLPHVTKHKNIEWLLTTMRLYLPANASLERNTFPVTKLSPEDSDFILDNSNYKNFLSVEYLQERIQKSYSAGIRENGKLVAWGLTHDDGALGSLHVLENHRGNGYGKAIVTSLIEQCRAGGKIPFAQIEEKNLPALGLVQKLGFKEDRRVTWIKLK